MQIAEYKYSILLGLMALILLNFSIVVNLYFNETTSSFYELLYLLSSIIGLICFIAAITLAMIKNQELNEDENA